MLSRVKQSIRGGFVTEPQPDCDCFEVEPPRPSELAELEVDDDEAAEELTR